MNTKKTTLSIAVATALSLTVVPAAQASLETFYEVEFTGLFTMLDGQFSAVKNTSEPYYSDPTWDGLRTQISGTMVFDGGIGEGVVSIEPFEFFNGGAMDINHFIMKSIGGGLYLGSLPFSWSSYDATISIVLDASGLVNAINSDLVVFGNTVEVDGNACVDFALDCAVAGSDGVEKSAYTMGPIPIATSTFNVAGDTGFGSTLGELSLGTDDSIGGSPMSNGPFSGTNFNFDFTSVRVTEAPVPAAVWLFGSGLLSLISVARRRRK